MRGQAICGCSEYDRRGGCDHTAKEAPLSCGYYPALDRQPFTVRPSPARWPKLRDVCCGSQHPVWLCSETRRNVSSRASVGRGYEGRQVLQFPGIVSRWGALFVAHRKCFCPDFSTGSAHSAICSRLPSSPGTLQPMSVLKKS